MNLSAIKQVGTRGVGIALLKVRKWAPEILTATGVVGVVASAVMASRATLKLEETLDKVEEGKAAVKKMEDQPDYTPENRRNDLVYIYTRGAVEIIKLYGPAVTLGVASLGAILSSHGIMKQRNAGLIAAYKVLETSYDKYRERIAEQLGDDVENDIYHGVEKRTSKISDDGKHRPEITRPPHMHMSPYAREFDRHNHLWNFKHDYNLQFLRSQERFANDRLQAQGHLFLNDVYEALGYPRCKEGQVVGWIRGGKDNYVSFNIPEPGSDEELDYFYYARESLLLDFNVDGVMWDKI